MSRVSRENTESTIWCPGANASVDLSEYATTELVFSEYYDLYCPIYFCGKHSSCNLCEKWQIGNLKTVE